MTVRLGPHLSSSLSRSTGAPQGCVLSPLLYSIYTHDCIPTHPSEAIINNKQTVVGQTSNGNKTAYREEVDRLVNLCTKKQAVPEF